MWIHFWIVSANCYKALNWHDTDPSHDSGPRVIKIVRAYVVYHSQWSHLTLYKENSICIRSPSRTSVDQCFNSSVRICPIICSHLHSTSLLVVFTPPPQLTPHPNLFSLQCFWSFYLRSLFSLYTKASEAGLNRLPFLKSQKLNIIITILRISFHYISNCQQVVTEFKLKSQPSLALQPQDLYYRKTRSHCTTWHCTTSLGHLTTLAFKAIDPTSCNNIRLSMS